MRAPPWVWLPLLTLAWPSEGRAAELTLTSKSVYHAYQVRLFPLSDNTTRRNLNRIYTTLDVGGWSIGDGGDIDAVLSLRYDTDFGTGFHRDTPAGVGIPAVDGRDDLDLMYLYVDWRNVVSGLLDLRVGRQLLLDDLTWYSLDGVKLTGHLWRSGEDGLDVELYAGLPVRIDLLFSSDPFLLDGTELDDASGVFGGVAFGGNAALRVLSGLSASVAYRQELEFRQDDLLNLNSNIAGAAGASGGLTGLVESRIAGSLGYTVRPAALDLYGHATYDLLLENLEQARAGATWHPGADFHVQAEYLRSRPRFAGDSIFNWFNIFPYDRGRLELSLEVLPGLTIDGAYLAQVFGGGEKGPKSDTTAGGEGATFLGSSWSHGPGGGVSYRQANFGVGGAFEVATNTGGNYAFGGNYRTFTVFGDLNFLEGRFGADGRLFLTTYQNDWFEDADLGQVDEARTSFIAQIGGRGQITDFLGARVLFAKNFDTVLEGSYRVYSELTVRY